MLSSVSNALRVLEYLVEHGEGGVSEIGRSLNLSPGTVYRLVSTLSYAGFADQNPENRKYRAGFKILEYANAMRSRVEFLDLAHPHLERLAERANETVNLGVLRGDDVVYVERIVSSQPVAVEVKVGSHVPAFCTAMGKVLLAHGENADRESYLDRLAELGDQSHTPPDKRRLAKDLQDVESRGYAEDNGEYSPDIMCVAAPVLNTRGMAIAAISASGPASRFRMRREALIPLVEIAGKELTILLNELGEHNPRL